MARKRPDISPDRPTSQGRRDGAGESARETAVSNLKLGQFYLASDSYSDAMDYFHRVEAEELLSTLSDAEAATLYVGLARCSAALGKYDEARDYAARVADVADRSDDAVVGAEADVIVARIEAKSGRFRKSLRAAKRAYTVLSRRPDSALLAEASKALGTAHAELGNMTAARDCLMDCLVCNRRLGNEEGVAGAYNNLGIIAKRSGDLSTAVDYFERALEIDRELGRPAAVARRLNNLGVAFYRMSRWAEAEERLEQAWEIYKRLGASRDIVAVESALGNLCRVRRDWNGARAYFTRVLRISREQGYRRAEALALEFLGDLEKDRGRFEIALSVLDQALECANRLSSTSDVVGEVLRRRAEVYLALGRLDEAESDCSSALEMCRRTGDRLEEGATLRVQAAVSYARGQRSAAGGLSLRAEQMQTRTGDTFELAMTALTDGAGLQRSGPVDESTLDFIESRLSTAERLFDSVGSSYWVARCSLERAKALRTAGRARRCRAWLEKARSELESVRDEEGLSELALLQRELDTEMAESVAARAGRYSVLAEALPLLRSTDRDPSALHSFVMAVADEISADRAVVFRHEGKAQPRVVTSVGRTGRRLAEVRRFARSAVEAGTSRPLIAASGTGRKMPSGVAALALIPAADSGGSDVVWLLYADRLKGDGVEAFSEADVEFLGASARMISRALAATCALDIHGEDGAGEEETVPCSNFITRDPATLDLIESVTRVCDSSIPVLLLGESGVGKDIIARFIHERSERPGRFVVLNSGAVPQQLQESELFGHVKGAFTDADRDREGLIESAGDGTLFLDEVGEMSQGLQVKLLRFLQSGEYRRVGDSSIRKSNARVLSATNVDLRAAVESGEFRRDLFYRLSALTVEISPLRERRCDITPLMEHFLSVYSELEGKHVPGFSDEVVSVFGHYDWHGNNVRELENEVRRGIALCEDGEKIGLDHVRPELAAMHHELTDGGGVPGAALTLREEVEALEQSRIREALDRHGRNKQDAADYLGLSRTGLYTKLRKYRME